ncbi:MAG TPA: nitroreductase/quinone reductase family protein [Candidatus Saccharimonadales bacterium]|nr:nitroreductase/quinone reductase family protein [Candidatus Saccharimonadales bacterium]
MILPRPALRVGWAIHRGLHRLTGGRLSTSKPANADQLGTLFLVTRGRSSGKERRTGLFYLDDGRNFAVVASNAGASNDPAWWRNLQSTPKAQVELGGATTPVIGRLATPEERSRLYPRFVSASANYATYEQTAGRPIPVVILEPDDPGPGG